ncbi:MAG: hypothetical protein P8181_03430 [bacterium]
MRLLIVLGIILMWFAGSAPAQPCSRILDVQCPIAQYPGTVCLLILVTNCNTQLAAFGFEMTFPGESLEFTGVETAGTLTEGWIETNGAPVLGMPDRVRLGGYDVDGFVGGTPDVLIKACFDVVAPIPAFSPVSIDNATLVDDVTGYTTFGCVLQGTVPTEGRTWGAIKEQYR